MKRFSSKSTEVSGRICISTDLTYRAAVNSGLSFPYASSAYMYRSYSCGYYYPKKTE